VSKNHFAIFHAQRDRCGPRVFAYGYGVGVVVDLDEIGGFLHGGGEIIQIFLSSTDHGKQLVIVRAKEFF